MYRTGVLVTPGDGFSFETWGYATSRYAISVGKLTDSDWREIITAAKALAKSPKRGMLTGTDTTEGDSDENTDDRANIFASESDEDVIDNTLEAAMNASLDA